MAAKKETVNFEDNLTVVAEEKQEEYKGPTVEVFLPELEEEGNGIKVDQYEHVTIANETGEKTWLVRRGMRVPVPVAVYVILKEKYPKI